MEWINMLRKPTIEEVTTFSITLAALVGICLLLLFGFYIEAVLTGGVDAVLPVVKDWGETLGIVYMTNLILLSYCAWKKKLV